MAGMIIFDPAPQLAIDASHTLYAPKGMQHPKDGLIFTVQLHNGVLLENDTVLFDDADQRQKVVDRYAAKYHLPPDPLGAVFMAMGDMVDTEIRYHNSLHVHSDPNQRYAMDAEGMYLVHNDGTRTPLTDFPVTMLAKITYDDGTGKLTQHMEIEATVRGRTTQHIISARDFSRMEWPIEILGPEAKIHVVPSVEKHLRSAIQTCSPAIATRTIFRHTGWREVDNQWHYLHSDGSITKEGFCTTVSVDLAGALASYRLPVPPTDPTRRREVFRASLALRTLAPGGGMMTILGATYVAPLRAFLGGHPPDFVTWITGASGRFKTEYAVLGLQHFGADFTSRTVPASFIDTGNSLERVSHAAKDALLLIDDYYPATDRQTRDAMDRAAGRLLRSIGNQTGRSRMQADTTLRPDLPPRCVALATGEHLPAGLSTNARLFLQHIDTPEDLATCKKHLTAAQDTKDCYSEAMACFLQWIAQHRSRLAHELPLLFRLLRDTAAALGTHAREPGHAAHLQLGWRVFTACAVDVGALTAEEREAILQETWKHLQALAIEQGALLHTDTTVQRFVGLLMSGFAAKRIYLRALDDQPPVQDGPETWGWTTRTIEGWQGRTDTVYDPGQAKMLGYLDAEYLYLLPEPLQEYLAQASRAADQTWHVDAKTLYRELDEAQLLTIKTGKKWPERVWGKTIQRRTIRVLHIKRTPLGALHSPDCDDDDPEAHPSIATDNDHESDHGIAI